MASFRIPIDLLKYLGASYQPVPFRERKEGESDEDYRKNGCNACICIPAALNGIKVEVDNQAEQYRNKSGFTAVLHVNVWPVQTEDRYVASVKRGLAADGKEITAFNVPSHEVKPSYDKDYYERMRPIFMKKVLLAHPEWQGQTPEQNEDLRKALNSITPFRLGYAWTIEPKRTASPTPAPTTTNFGYVAPQPMQIEEDPFSAPWADQADSDIPF